MDEDEQAIRQVVAAWMAASRAGDGAAVLALMEEDAVFMVPGREPFGREAFEAAAGAGGPRVEGESQIVELQVMGDWAFTRNRLDLTITPPGGAPMRRGGYALTLFHRGPDGRWRLARDANLTATLA